MKLCKQKLGILEAWDLGRCGPSTECIEPGKIRRTPVRELADDRVSYTFVPLRLFHLWLECPNTFPQGLGASY